VQKERDYNLIIYIIKATQLWRSKMKTRFTYVGIRVKDLEKSIEFYTKVLGMSISGRAKVEQCNGETVDLVSEKGGFPLELNFYEKNSSYNYPYSVGEGLDHLAFKVDNLDKALEEAQKLGHSAVLKMKSDGGRWAYIEDPNGIWIELF
jgi:lactoylglutathione lyase